MSLSRQDALALPGGGGSRQRSRGYVTVREPAKGFFFAGSNLEELNGIYGSVDPSRVVLVRTAGLPLRRPPQLAYRNDKSGWLMVLSRAPASQVPRRRPEQRKSHSQRDMCMTSSDSDNQDEGFSSQAAMEWCLVDTFGRERFSHKGDTIIPGAGHRWTHLHRWAGYTDANASGRQLFWHDCQEEGFETADEEEEEATSELRQPRLEPPLTEEAARQALVEVKDDEDELPWQVIAILDHSVVRDLRWSHRHYESTVSSAMDGSNLARPGPSSLEYCVQQASCWVYRVVHRAGVDLRSQPKILARCREHRALGEYVCGLERQGLWLRVAGATDPNSRGRRGDSDGSDEESLRNSLWVVLMDRSGVVYLEAVPEADLGTLIVPSEVDPEADTFDRPFEPRLRSADPFEEAAADKPEGEEDKKALSWDAAKAEEEEAQLAAREAAKPFEPEELCVGAEAVLQGLSDYERNGQVCTIVSLPARDAGGGRCVVQIRSGSKDRIAVRLANLRQPRAKEESEASYSARLLGLSLAELGWAGGGGSSSSSAPPPALLPSRERLASALRAAQRDLAEVPESLVEAQRAFDLLADALAKNEAVWPQSHTGVSAPPHVLVESGLLGRRAAQAASRAASERSVKEAEEGLEALRRLLSDEQRRLARSAGLDWPIPAARLPEAPPEGVDALRLRLTIVRALLRSRQDEKAVQEAALAVRRCSTSAAAHLWAGRCLLRVGRREEGIQCLSASTSGDCVAEGPDGAWGQIGAKLRLQALSRTEASKNAAEDAYAYGDFKTAASRYGEALLACPSDDRWGRAMLLAGRAACHRRARELRTAVEDCDAALLLFPRYARALFRRGACLLEAGRSAEAIKAFEVLLRVDRKWTGLSDWLIRSHAHARRVEKEGVGGFKGSKRGKARSDAWDEDPSAAASEAALGGSDLYAVLGVSSDATEQQLKRAYRLMSLKYHPDKEGGSTRCFQQIATAYETLSDEAKRKAYDDGADLKKGRNEDSDSDREEKTLREEVERKYFPERYKFWPFGDPFIEKRKLLATRRKQAEAQNRRAWDFDDY